jgi:hypothetical protein
MFNLFKKKETKPVPPSPEEAKNDLRKTMFGFLGPMEWPKGKIDGIPWSLFMEARDQVTAKQNFQGAIDIYKKILAMPDLESRHYLQAWFFLHRLSVESSPEEATRVYGVLVDVCLQNGTEYVVAYADHHARYMNYTGGGVIWEAPDRSLNDKIDALLSAGESVAAQVPPLESGLPIPPKEVDAVQICILTPGGIRHGIGTFDGWAKSPGGGPIVAAATDLMRSLVDKSSKK